jgi:hypothetical protein
MASKPPTPTNMFLLKFAIPITVRSNDQVVSPLVSAQTRIGECKLPIITFVWDDLTNRQD